MFCDVKIEWKYVERVQNAECSTESRETQKCNEWKAKGRNVYRVQMSKVWKERKEMGQNEGEYDIVCVENVTQNVRHKISSQYQL